MFKLLRQGGGCIGFVRQFFLVLHIIKMISTNKFFFKLFRKTLHFGGHVLIQSPNKLGGTAFMVLSLKGQRGRRAEREERAAVRKEQSRASCPGSHPAGVLPGQLALAARQS